ncbi:MAG: hypothetical protein JNM85_04100 [Chthonomonas sp.]|nr:hypothetical protein [Chthonomonas sp.]
MTLSKWWSVLGLFATSAVATATALPFAIAEAKAAYQGTSSTPSAAGLFFPQAVIPASVSNRAYVPKSGSTGFGDGTRVVAYDDADAMAMTTIPGVDGAYARAGGWSPGGGPPNGVFAEASIRIHSNWVATGPTATTLIDLFSFFDGYLYASSNSATSDKVWASVKVEMTLESSMGVTSLFLADGNLNLKNGLTTSLTTNNGWSAAGWNSSWTNSTGTMTSTNGHDFLWDQHYVENIQDIVEVPTGEVIGLDYKMTVTAQNDQGPFEIFSTSDYSHTADLDLRTHRAGYSIREVNLAVPEPDTNLTLGLGCLAITTYRRRRARR